MELYGVPAGAGTPRLMLERSARWAHGMCGAYLVRHIRQIKYVMKRMFVVLGTVCFLLTSFLPVITLTKGPGHIIGHMPLWVIYPGLVDMIRLGDFRYIHLILLWVALHLFLTIAPAWILTRILKRRKQSRAG